MRRLLMAMVLVLGVLLLQAQLQITENDEVVAFQRALYVAGPP